MFKRYEIFKFKLQVVKFAWESNNYAAGREFGINEKLVCDWQKQVKKLKCMPKNKCCNRKKQCQWPKLKDKLLCWIKEQRQWLHHHPKHGHHQGEGSGHQNSDNRVPGLQPLVYEVPSMEKSCSLTEEKDCPKVSRRSWPEDYKLPQLCHQEQKEAKLQTRPHLQHGQNACLVWPAISQNHEWEMGKARKLCWSTQLVTRNHSSLSYLCAWQMEQSLSLWWSLNRRSCQKRTFHPEFSYTVIWRGGWMKLEWSCE